jgi:transcription initiation factor IIE alpha subunit
MSLFGKLLGKKKPQDTHDEKKEREEFVICPHCYLDYTVKQVQESGGVCPSCKGEIDLDKLPRAQIK